MSALVYKLPQRLEVVIVSCPALELGTELRLWDDSKWSLTTEQSLQPLRFIAYDFSNE